MLCDMRANSPILLSVPVATRKLQLQCPASCRGNELPLTHGMTARTTIKLLAAYTRLVIFQQKQPQPIMCRCNLKCISDPGGHAMCRMRTFGQVLGPPIRQERLPTLTLMVHSLPVLELLVAAVQPLLTLLLHNLCCQLQQVHRCKTAAVLPQAGCR